MVDKDKDWCFQMNSDWMAKSCEPGQRLNESPF